MLAELRRAAGRLGVPACVLTFEPHPREFFAPDKAPTRLTSLREKLELLAGFGVDRVHLCRFNYAFAQITAEDFIERIIVRGLGARWVLVGDDFRFGARRGGRPRDAEAGGAALRLRGRRAGERARSTASASPAPRCAPRSPRASSIARGGCSGAPIRSAGAWCAATGWAASSGFPTANVQMKHNRPPLTGIFVVELHGVGREPLRGVASLGVRPTVRQQGAPVLEVHLLDFDGDLYRRHVRVEFLHKLRDEEKYADLATLTRQIALDVENAKAYFHRRDAEAQRTAKA